METRAPFVIVGAFVLAAIVAVFGFVYWLQNTGGLGPRASYRVQFEGSVPGLLVGAAVLFNGIRVGEVTELGLAPGNPRGVNATISVAATTPVRADTKVGLEFQGLTGVPVIALEGGTQVAQSGEVPTLVAEPGAGQGMTQAARDALRKVDTVLSENSGALKDTIANLKVFSEGLARNTGKLDGIVAGLERMTGVTSPPPKITYDLRALQNPGPVGKAINVQWAIPEPTAVAMLETQRFLFSPAQEYPGIRGGDVGRCAAETDPGAADRKFRELRHRACAAARDRYRADRIPVADRRQAVPHRHRIRAGSRDRLVGQDRRQERQGRRLAAVRGTREICDRRAGRGGRRVQRSVRPNCEERDRLDGSGVLGEAGAASALVASCSRSAYSSVFRYASRSPIWSGSSWKAGIVGCPV